MPFDALLTLYRAAVVDGNVTGDAKFLGANTGATVTLRIGGDVTGTNPTFDWKVQRSADGVSSWTDIASGTQVTDEMVGYIATTTPRYEVPGEDPLSMDIYTTQDYVRAVITIGGTATPTFRVVSIEMEPHGRAYVRSGR